MNINRNEIYKIMCSIVFSPNDCTLKYEKNDTLFHNTF